MGIGTWRGRVKTEQEIRERLKSAIFELRETEEMYDDYSIDKARIESEVNVLNWVLGK